VPRSTKKHLQLHFRVRPFLVRWLVSAITLAITVLIVPNVFFSSPDFVILSYVIISGVFGLLNAFIKPLFQLLLLPLIFVSYGLIIVVINTVILYLLSVIFPDRFHVEHILWAVAGGIVSGLVFTVLENLFGLAPPIMLSAPSDVQHQIDEGGPGLVESGILKVAKHGATAPLAPSEKPDQATVATALLKTLDGSTEGGGEPVPVADVLEHPADQPVAAEPRAAADAPPGPREGAST
jgi:putative membrane protein